MLAWDASSYAADGIGSRGQKNQPILEIKYLDFKNPAKFSFNLECCYEATV